MKFILASILCLSLVSSTSYALDVDGGGLPGIELPPLLPLPVPDSYPESPDECGETPCQQACNQNYQDCMDSADAIDGYCSFIPEGPTKQACHRAASLLRNACLMARDACNQDCADRGLAGSSEVLSEF